jgi:uncharacterized membrane protein YraQ (UPF0718 family)
MAVAQPLRREQSWTRLGAAMVALVATGALIRVTDPGSVAPALQNFFLVFGSLLIEAIPFVLLGAFVSAAIEVFLPASALERLARLPRPMQLPAAGLAGLGFPVCECGSVPVARRLVSKGLAPSAAVTFMLAAPILNPIVIASTVVAYRGRGIMPLMVFGRAGLGLLAAVAVGFAVSDRTKETLLKADPDATSLDHGHEHVGRVAGFFSHLSGDFFFMGRFLVLGATVAAALQTFVPQSILGSVADTPFLNLIALMTLAFLLSLCSESDAFVAASFVQFGPGAQLAFLVFGPMVDTKLGFLYSGTFKRGFLRTVVVVAGAVILAAALWIEVIAG